MLRIAAIFLLGSTTVLCNAWGAPQWQADVKVLSVHTKETGNSWYCTASIHNHWDDDARETKVMVLLPVAVNYTGAGMSPAVGSCAPNNYSGGGNGTNSYVVCELGNMAVNQLVDITVRTTRPPKSLNRRECGVFAWSETPDPDRRNNYAVSP